MPYRTPPPLRACSRSDLAAVFALEDLVYGAADSLAPYGLAQHLELFPEHFLVAQTRDGLAGFAVGGLAAPRARSSGWLLDVAVHPAARGRGVGRALVMAVAESLHARGAETVRATVSPDNGASLRMLTQCGFQPERLVDDYFGPGRARWVVARRT